MRKVVLKIMRNELSESKFWNVVFEEIEYEIRRYVGKNRSVVMNELDTNFWEVKDICEFELEEHSDGMVVTIYFMEGV